MFKFNESFNVFMMNYVYIITDGEGYKIGFSKSPEKRLKELQTANKNKLQLIHTQEVKFGQQTERALHNFLAQYRQEGEWFLLSLDLIEQTKKLCLTIENNLNYLKLHKI